MKRLLAFLLFALPLSAQINNPSGGATGAAAITSGTIAGVTSVGTGTLTASSDIVSSTAVYVPQIFVGGNTNGNGFGNGSIHLLGGTETGNSGVFFYNDTNAHLNSSDPFHVGGTGAWDFAAAVSVAFAGTTTVPTMAAGNATTNAASTAFVTTAITNATTGTTATLTGGTNTGAVTCLTAACTSRRGTFSVVGATATTGTVATVAFTATSSAQVCMVTQNGGTGNLGIGNSVATTTGFNVTAANSVAGVTFTVNYSCQP